MNGNKGQGAMEYLMTYGWAILVVMIVGIVMWQLGIFNMGSTSITSTGFSKIKPQLAGSGMKADGTFTGVFTNGVGTGITVITAGAEDTIANESMTGLQCELAVDPATATSIAAGDNFVLTGSSCALGNAGDVYSARIQISYTVRIGTVTSSHKDTGTIRGPYES